MHQFKATIFPKRGEPFSLIVGACLAPWTSFAFCVYAITLDEGLAQKICPVTKPQPGGGRASAQLWLLAEGWRRAGATVDMSAQPKDRLVSWPKARFEDWSRTVLESCILDSLREDWLGYAAQITNGDAIIGAFMKVTDTIRLGPPR